MDTDYGNYDNPTPQPTVDHRTQTRPCLCPMALASGGGREECVGNPSPPAPPARTRILRVNNLHQPEACPFIGTCNSEPGGHRQHRSRRCRAWECNAGHSVA